MQATLGVEIRFAVDADAEVVSSVLLEAAGWIASRGAPLWPVEQLLPGIAPDIAAGRYLLASVGASAVGTARLTREDPECWPDAEPGSAVYVHRLAVRRAWAGRGLAGEILAWCTEHAEALGRGYVRLDCDAARTKLRSLYEGLGFQFHSQRAVGPFTVARYQRAVPHPCNTRGVQR